MPIIDTNTGRVIVTDEDLIKEAKEWIGSKSNKEWEKLIKEEHDKFVKEKAGEGE